jgi:Uma2 family endonuclease
MIRLMATTALMSFAEFERLDWGSDHLEFLEGELIRMPPPQDSHMNTSEGLYDRLKPAVEHLRQATPDRRFGKVHIERGYYLPGEPGSWLQPDVSVTHPDQPIDRYYLGAPLIAFEVVSRNDRAADLDRKVAQYLTRGAAEVWLIYPNSRHALVFDASGVRNETRAIQTALLPGVEIPLEQIF